MDAAAEAMELERADTVRDRIGQMHEAIGKPLASVSERDPNARKSRKAKKKPGDPAQWKGRVPRPKRSI